MVRKVVIPATISVLALVLFSLSLKIRSSIRRLPRLSRRVCGHCPVQNQSCPACLPLQAAFHTVRGHPGRPERGPNQNADEPVLSADPEGESGRGADRLAPPDAARRARPPDQRRHLRLAAARLSRAEEHRAHRARGAGRHGRPGSADADHPVGRPVARERPLRRLWPRDAAHQGPPRSRHALRPDQRGDDHRALPRRREELSRPAQEPLSHPVEVPRRGAAALRRHARTRVPDEGQLLLRRRQGGRHALLQQDVRGLPAHLRAHGPEGDPDARRYRPDRRRPEPRVHRPGRDRRERRVLPQGAGRQGHPEPQDRLRRRSPADRERVDVALRRDRRKARQGGVREDPRKRAVGRARHRGRPYFLLRHQVFRADEGGRGRSRRRADHGRDGLLRHRRVAPGRRHHRGEPRRRRHHLAGVGGAVQGGHRQSQARRRRRVRRLPEAL